MNIRQLRREIALKLNFASEAAKNKELSPELKRYWEGCRDVLRELIAADITHDLN